MIREIRLDPGSLGYVFQQFYLRVVCQSVHLELSFCVSNILDTSLCRWNNKSTSGLRWKMEPGLKYIFPICVILTAIDTLE